MAQQKTLSALKGLLELHKKTVKAKQEVWSATNQEHEALMSIVREPETLSEMVCLGIFNINFRAMDRVVERSRKE